MSEVQQNAPYSTKMQQFKRPISDHFLLNSKFKRSFWHLESLKAVYLRTRLPGSVLPVCAPEIKTALPLGLLLPALPSRLWVPCSGMNDIERTIAEVEGMAFLGLHVEAWEELETLPPSARLLTDVLAVRLLICAALPRFECLS